MQEDWDKDKFPTSAAPVFRGLGLLFLIIIAFCGVVYLLSEHPQEKEDQNKKQQAVEDFSPEDDEAAEEVSPEVETPAK